MNSISLNFNFQDFLIVRHVSLSECSKMPRQDSPVGPPDRPISLCCWSNYYLATGVYPVNLAVTSCRPTSCILHFPIYSEDKQLVD